jgi:hypothetical protein
MAKKISQEADNRHDLGNAEFCDQLLGEEVRCVVKGDMQSCPTLIVKELRGLIGNCPNITTVADATFEVAKVGISTMKEMIAFDVQQKSAKTLLTSGLSTDQVTTALTDFRVRLHCPNCKLSYRLCGHCFGEIYGVASNLQLSLDEVIKVALVTGLAFEDSISESRRLVFYEEFERFDKWQLLRFALWGG